MHNMIDELFVVSIIIPFVIGFVVYTSPILRS